MEGILAECLKKTRISTAFSLLNREIKEFTLFENPLIILVLCAKGGGRMEEMAVRTYAILKEEYVSLKVLLNVLGVNLTDIDKIKE